MSKAIKYCTECGIRAHGYGLCRLHYNLKYRKSTDDGYFRTLKGRYRVLIHNAKLRNLAVDITIMEFQDLLQNSQGLCYYCENPVGRGSVADRIDNSKGYLKDNIKICCFGCNRLKSNILTLEETKRIVKVLKSMRKTKYIWEAK